MIVEEAAHVLESHVVSSLTPDCQQLIMIGDHQQLRPPVNVYHLAKDYHLDVSLFERLILGGIKSVRLDVQHRMRPEVARLIVPPSIHNWRTTEAFTTTPTSLECNVTYVTF